MKLLTIGFEFSGEYHYAIIQRKEKDDTTHYQATVMNGRLEKILFGRHIFTEKQNSILLELSDEETEQARLRRKIAEALSQHLQKALI